MLELLSAVQEGPIFHCFCLGWVYLQLSTHESYGDMKVIFRFDIQSVRFFNSCLKTNVGLNFFKAVGENEDVVQIDKRKLVKEVSEHMVNPILKNSRDICKSNRDNQLFKVFYVCFECSLPLVSFMDSNKMVHIAEVKFGQSCSLLDCFWTSIYLF